MRRIALLVVAACALVAPRAALAEPLQITGFVCGYSALHDPTSVDPATQVGELDGGPIVVPGPDGVPVDATLTCSIQVNGFRHADPDAVTVTSARSPAPTIPPTVVTYQADAEDYVSVCTRLDLADGTTLYFTAGPDTWTTDPLAYCQELDACADCGPPPFDYTFADAIVCPIFELVFPPDGDIPVLWDCPPYAR